MLRQSACPNEEEDSRTMNNKEKAKHKSFAPEKHEAHLWKALAAPQSVDNPNVEE